MFNLSKSFLTYVILRIDGNMPSKRNPTSLSKFCRYQHIQCPPLRITRFAKSTLPSNLVNGVFSRIEADVFFITAAMEIPQLLFLMKLQSLARLFVCFFFWVQPPEISHPRRLITFFFVLERLNYYCCCAVSVSYRLLNNSAFSGRENLLCFAKKTTFRPARRVRWNLIMQYVCVYVCGVFLSLTRRRVTSK